MRLARFYCESITVGENALCGEESHHLIHVNRLGAGDEIELFDGNGVCANAKVIKAKRSEVIVEVSDIRTVTKPKTRRITIAASIPKGKRFDWMISKCTELGVDAIVPLIFDRTVKQPAETQARCTRIAVSAAKQSGNLFLPSFSEPKKIKVFLDSITTDNPDASVFFGDLSPEAQNVQKLADAINDTIAIIGPEGGITESEIQLLRHYRATGVKLTNTVLRVETAAVALASVLCSFRDANCRLF